MHRPSAPTLGVGISGTRSRRTVMTQNPLLNPWPGPYGGVPPWSEVRPEYLPDALQAAVDEQRREVESIANNPDAPTFDFQAGTFNGLRCLHVH